MSVLLVTDDADDGIPIDLLTAPNDNFYKQLKELQYDFSSSVTSFPIVESSSSILVKSNQPSRQARRRRRCRVQQCVVQHLLTYMLTLLLLTNHLHWPVLILSLSSIKIMSTHASTTTIGTSANPTTMKRPISTPSTTRLSSRQDEQQCFPLDGSHIDRLCSKTCRAQKSPFEKFDNFASFKIDAHFLPFCSNLLNQTFIKENFFHTATERECRKTLKQLTASDTEARQASEFFATYMQAIDSASKENRYSIIVADCQVNFSLNFLPRKTSLLFVFRQPIELGLVQYESLISITIISYRLAKRSVMKSSVFVRHFDPVITNHYLQDNHCFFVMVISPVSISSHQTKGYSSLRVLDR